jgi:Mg-chelatase subunit ChlD
VSPFESAQTLILDPASFSMQTVLLLDLSGSVIVYIEQLKAAIASFITTCAVENNQIAIFGFGGNATEPLVPIMPQYTNQKELLLNAVSNLESFVPKDRSTNLYGAIIDTVEEMKSRLHRTNSSYTKGVMVVFTDGTDRANVHTVQEAVTSIQSMDAATFSIVVGGEIDPKTLNVSCIFFTFVFFWKKLKHLTQRTI